MVNLELLSLLEATGTTIYMVFVSALVGISAGLFLGIILFLTGHDQVLENKSIHNVLNLTVNIGRSIPFIILLICLIPVTRLIVGTSIGTNAALLPLIVTTIPFFARITASAFSEVSHGLIETSEAFGASTWQLVQRVLIPESLSSLIRGATLTIIGLVGCSAMAGAVGGGGLGELAINYGYERFNTLVILETVIAITLLVQLIQYIGDRLARHCNLKWVGASIAGIASICLLSQVYAYLPSYTHVLRVGVINGEDVGLLTVVQKLAKEKYGLEIKVIGFDDYVQPNVALSNGSIDANIFQHVPFLNAQIKSHGYHITPVAKTFVYPFGFYSNKIHKLSELKRGDMVAIPNDPSNEGRALLLLSDNHLITLKPGSGLFATPSDIAENPYDLQFKELNVAQIARSLNDVAIGGLTNDYTKPAGFKVSDAVVKESPDSPYANVVAVRSADVHRSDIKKLISAIHSKQYLQATEKAFPNGAAIAAFVPIQL